MGYQEEGSVYELPWEYECSEDSGSSLTAEQYKEIVSFAEWQGRGEGEGKTNCHISYV